MRLIRVRFKTQLMLVSPRVSGGEALILSGQQWQEGVVLGKGYDYQRG